MVRMITDEEMEKAMEERRRRAAELLELKKRLTEIVDDLKQKLHRAVEELKKVKEENRKLSEDLKDVHSRNADLESEVQKLREQLAGGAEDQSLREEVERLKAIIEDKDKEIKITREVMERANSYKEELEKRISDLTEELHRMTEVMLSARPASPAPQPLFTVVDEPPRAAVDAPERRPVSGVRPQSRLLTGTGSGGGLLRPLGGQQPAAPGGVSETARPPRPVSLAEETPGGTSAPEGGAIEFPPPATSSTEEGGAETSPEPPKAATGAAGPTAGRAICPVCGGEGVIGVRKKDGTIVQEICPNCKGAGKV